MIGANENEGHDQPSHALFCQREIFLCSFRFFSLLFYLALIVIFYRIFLCNYARFGGEPAVSL